MSAAAARRPRHSDARNSSRSRAHRTAAAGQQVIQRRADGVDVGAHVERVAAKLFGRRVLRRALKPPPPSSPHVARSVEMDRPKSPTFTAPSASMKQFDGLMSRWRMPAAWAASRPPMTWSMAATASAEQRPWRDAILQRAARQQLHRDRGHATDFLAAEDVDRVRVTD